MITNIRKLLLSLKGKKVLVIGDVMLDEFIWGKVSRISPEAPVPVVAVEKSTYVPGGAANVARNIQSLEGRVMLTGVVGSDETADRLKGELGSMDIECGGLVRDVTRPTTLKTRVIAHSQQMVRIDREKESLLSASVRETLLSAIQERIPSVHAVAFSDYDKGIAHDFLIDGILKAVRKHKKPLVVDPKPKNFLKWKKATVLTPNIMEASQAMNRSLNTKKDLSDLARDVHHRLGIAALLVTRGEHGMSLFQRGRSAVDIPAVASQVYDVTGAGDTVTAALTLGLAAGGDIFTATYLANFAAGIVVRKVGTASAAIHEIDEFLHAYKKSKTQD